MLEVEDVEDVACTAVPDDMEATDERGWCEGRVERGLRVQIDGSPSFRRRKAEAVDHEVMHR